MTTTQECLAKKPARDRADDIPAGYQAETDHSGLELSKSSGINQPSDMKMAQWRGVMNGLITPQCSTFHSLIYMLDSAVSERADHPSQPLLNRTITIQPASTSTQWHSDAGVEFIHVYLRMDSLNDIARSIFDREPDGGLLPELVGFFDYDLARLIEHGATCMGRPIAVSRLEQDAWGQLIGEYLLRNKSNLVGFNETETSSDLSNAALTRVIDSIEANLGDDMSLESLAALCSMTRTNFCKAFKRAINVSPHQYVLERRLTKARELLKAKESPIAEIAYVVGFCSQAHMTDVFRKRLGVTPGKFRKHATE